IAGWRASAVGFGYPLILGLEAQQQMARGEQALAAELLDEALEAVERAGERYFEAEILRLKGELAFRSEDPAAGRSWLDRSLETAREQGALSLELRAATSLVRWCGQSDPSISGDALVPCLSGFPGALQTRDLVEARELLASQSRTPLPLVTEPVDIART
ncbi:MAG: hypothetical protein KDD47_19965, partial [Acidobacteria bacterium]|nr:hypothetical protein [Acidobacteriota bacterium]